MPKTDEAPCLSNLRKSCSPENRWQVTGDRVTGGLEAFEQLSREERGVADWSARATPVRDVQLAADARHAICRAVVGVRRRQVMEEEARQNPIERTIAVRQVRR
jgi:hypothetical protein